MAKLPQTTIDPTLAAADRAIEDAAKPRYSNSLGPSWVGAACERQSYYKLRHTRLPKFDAAALKRFEDGHLSEDIAIKRIRAAGVEWHSHDAQTGKQYGFTALAGKMTGYYDGVCIGLLQAPTKWHIGEIKASAKWADLDKMAFKFGPKNALLNWNETYYGQGQLYMHAENIDRHYTVVVSPGARDWTSCRTDYDPVYAMKLMAKGERIIFSDNAPPRISDTPTSFACRFCDFIDVCHMGALPDRQCRSCIHATPNRDAPGWSCAMGKEMLPCADHRWIPSMLAMEQTDVIDGVVHYQMKDGGSYEDRGLAND